MMMGRVASVTLAGMACMLLAMAATGCGHQAAKHADGDNGTPSIDTSEVEAVARAFVEIGFDYRDQKSEYDQLQPLLADKYPFQEDPYAVTTQSIWTSRVLATRVVSISDDDAIVTVTAEQFHQYLPDQSSKVVEDHLLRQSDCLLVLQEGQWLVSISATLSEEPLAQEDGETPSNAPTPSTEVLAVPTAHQEEIREAIEELFLHTVGHSVEIGGNTYYVDSSGTEWVGFTVFPVPATATDPTFGVAKRASGQSWELAFWGTGPIHDIPDDVAKGLGIDWRR